MTKNKKKRKGRSQAQLPPEAVSPPPSAGSGEPNLAGSGDPDSPAARPYRSARVLAAALLALASLWAYLPTLMWLLNAWNTQPDYSHGFLVPLLSIAFLWIRRETFPGLSASLEWPGLLLIAGSLALRVAGALAYVESVDGWSLVLWVAGVVWLLTGWRAFRWSLPSIAFLFFMVPLPFRVEHMLSLPLQKIATQISCATLVCLGQPALAEGNTILLGDNQLEVEQACSGLRIFVGIVALACAYVIVVKRSWWEKLLLLASTLPIALIANSTRIVVTGLLWHNVSGEMAHRFSHDLAGWFMIPLAAAMFGLCLWYLDKLFPVVERASMRSVVRAGEELSENTAGSQLSISKG